MNEEELQAAAKAAYDVFEREFERLEDLVYPSLVEDILRSLMKAGYKIVPPNPNYTEVDRGRHVVSVDIGMGGQVTVTKPE